MSRSTPQEYLRWVADIIEANPDEYDQSYWYSTGTGIGVGMSTNAYSCSAACCIAGWVAACAVSEGHPHGLAPNVARHALALSRAQADVLFSGSPHRCWPSPYRWLMATTRAAEAAVASSLLRALADGEVKLGGAS